MQGFLFWGSHIPEITSKLCIYTTFLWEECPHYESNFQGVQTQQCVNSEFQGSQENTKSVRRGGRDRKMKLLTISKFSTEANTSSSSSLLPYSELPATFTFFFQNTPKENKGTVFKYYWKYITNTNYIFATSFFNIKY